MTSRLNVTRASLLFSFFLSAGCGNDSPTGPTSDFIAVTSIVPAAGTTLNAGARVTFTAVVTSTIVSSNGGSVAMVLQDQATRSLMGPGEVQPQATVQKGTTTVTLSSTVSVPESGGTVTAFFPVFITESSSTRAVAVRTYPVR
jgi:hypothetical protein